MLHILVAVLWLVKPAWTRRPIYAAFVTALRRATATDVARAAGVSRAAVSKVIRNAYGVSDDMRERVLAAIEQLGYRPSVAARATRGTRSYTIGFELHDLENPALSRILRGAAAGVDGSGYQLIIAPGGVADEQGVEAIEALVDRGVDGLVVVAPNTPRSALEELAQRLPIVLLSRHDVSPHYDTMSGDDIAGTRLAMNHLFDLGHERIAHLTWSQDQTSLGVPAAVRLQEYERIMRLSGHEQHVRLVRTDGDDRSVYGAASAVINAPDRPTAIFAANDDLALIVLRAVSDAGLTARDVSVVGYDNIRIADHPGIALTTVDQHGDELGHRAVDLLLERLDGRTNTRQESTKPTLMVRGSTMPAT